MKNLIIYLLSSFLWFTPTLQCDAAHFSVTDVLLIKTNIASAKRDLAEQLLQFDNGASQIKQLFEQIKQAEDLLKRLGKPEDIKDLPGFGREINAFLRRVERNLPTFEIIREIDPDEIFKREQGSPYEKISKEIIVNGKQVAEVKGDTLKPELATRRTIAHYHKVREAVLKERQILKGDLQLAMTRLQAAATTAEVDKLNGVIGGLRTLLAANDADMQFAASSVATQNYEQLNEEKIQRKVQVQKDRADLKEGMRKHLQFFTLPSRPALIKPRN